MAVLKSIYKLEVKAPRHKQNECKYCRNLLGGKRTSQEPWNTILYESDNFAVVPTLGSMIEGWLLVVTKEHYLCMGAIPPSLWSELRCMLDLTTKAVARDYTPPTIFEHGPKWEELSVGCGIDHAHLHVVPLHFSLIARAKESTELGRFPWFQLESVWSSLSQLHQSKQSYIYIKESSKMSYYCTPDAVPCQSLRRIIARELMIPTLYNYNDYTFRENVESTISSVKRSFADSNL